MWYILKTEIRYNISGLSIASGIILLLSTATFTWEVMDLYGLIINSSIACFLLIAAVGSDSDKQKRDRLYALLPLPLKRLGWTRLQFLLVFQAGVLVLWLVAYFIEMPKVGGEAIWIILSANGIFLSIILVFAIFHDLGFFGTRKYQTLFFVILFVALLLAYIQRPDLLFVRVVDMGHAAHVIGLYRNLIMSPEGAVTANVICIGLFYTDVAVYRRRRSYLG